MHDVKYLKIDKLPKFYKDVLTSWQEIRQSKEIEKEITDEIIWNNKNLKIDGKPFFNKTWFNAGIIRVKDLLDTNCKWLSTQSIYQKYKVNTHFLTLQRIISSILQLWKEKIKTLTHILHGHAIYLFVQVAVELKELILSCCFQEID